MTLTLERKEDEFWKDRIDNVLLFVLFLFFFFRAFNPDQWVPAGLRERHRGKQCRDWRFGGMDGWTGDGWLLSGGMGWWRDGTRMQLQTDCCLSLVADRLILLVFSYSASPSLFLLSVGILWPSLLLYQAAAAAELFLHINRRRCCVLCSSSLLTRLPLLLFSISVSSFASVTLSYQLHRSLTQSINQSISLVLWAWPMTRKIKSRRGNFQDKKTKQAVMRQ